jgi:hypothetical protein
MNMKWKMGVVFIAALAIETANFRFGGVALDPGGLMDMPWHLKMIAIEWSLLHAPGIMVLNILDWLGRRGASVAPGTLPPANLSSHWGSAIVIFIGGYLATALVLFTIGLSAQWFLRRRRNHTAENSIRLA